MSIGISVLGSTGSIGTQALDVIRQSEGGYFVSALCAGTNITLLSAQANEFMPPVIGIDDKNSVPALKQLLKYSPEIYAGKEAANICAAIPNADVAVTGISGALCLEPFLCAIKAGKRIAAANKESIIYAHSLIDDYKLHKNAPLTDLLITGAQIVPVDSEQSAIFQCLEEKNNVKSLILTASGGAFRNKKLTELENVTYIDALSHPTWSMGKKITIDSATLFNKGLEIMEAAFLFGFSADEVEVLIHPESIVHSMVRFRDGSIKAQISVPDMRGAIQYAITYPNRYNSPISDIDLTEKPLTFFAPDTSKYPSIPLAYEALREGKVLPIIYNAANEVAVDRFIKGECGYFDIAEIVSNTMKNANNDFKSESICDIMEVDAYARDKAKDMRCSFRKSF